MRIQIPDSLYTSDALASAALILALVLARLIAGRALRRRDSLTEQVARRWSANVRNMLVLIGFIGLIMIWAPQLQTLALSLTAVAVAIVVATKELILCLSGAALRTFTRAFSVGDIVEIGGSKGEVLDLTLLAARLWEFEPRGGSIAATGRSIILPYSLLFSSPAKVLSHSGGGALHRFNLTFESDVDIFALRTEIENAANEAFAEVSSQKENSAADPALELNFGTSDIGKYRIEIALFRHPDTAQKAENALTCAIASLVHRKRTEQAFTSSAAQGAVEAEESSEPAARGL